jgi:lipoprotein-anchoring transpeptidase ErfK/SrfK
MAVNYGKKQGNKNVVFYIAAVIILAGAAAVFFYPFGKKKQNQEVQPAEQTSPVQQTPVKQEQVQSQQTQPAGGFGQVVSEANNVAGPRVLALLKDAQQCISEGKIVAARNTLNDVLNMAMEDSLRQQVKQQMQTLANDWLFSKAVQFGDNLCTNYKVESGDLLSGIAAKYKVPYKFLMKINNIQSEKSLRSGQIIKVVNGPFHAVAYLSSFTMDLYLQNVYVKTYKIGTGKPSKPTPIGLWRAKVGGKLIKPIWTDPETGRTFKPDDPDYPLGSGWIALEGIDNRTQNISGIAIHGTKDEATIGTKSSQGCIRLYNGELIEVYDMFEAGCSELRTVE